MRSYRRIADIMVYQSCFGCMRVFRMNEDATQQLDISLIALQSTCPIQLCTPVRFNYVHWYCLTIHTLFFKVRLSSWESFGPRSVSIAVLSFWTRHPAPPPARCKAFGSTASPASGSPRGPSGPRRSPPSSKLQTSSQGNPTQRSDVQKGNGTLWYYYRQILDHYVSLLHGSPLS